MKVGIITLPLHTNYGGILQAYALKTFLESVGHEAVVLDPIDKMPAPGGLRAPFVYASRMLKRGLKGKKGPEVFREHRFRRELPVVGKNTSAFVEKYISPRMISLSPKYTGSGLILSLWYSRSIIRRFSP